MFLYYAIVVYKVQKIFKNFSFLYLLATTKVLHTLVKQYPMVSFHQESQRLAIGTKDSVIIIYDLKTASRWHILEVYMKFIFFFLILIKGHHSAITAVSFVTNGKILASYSIEDNEV